MHRALVVPLPVALALLSLRASALDPAAAAPAGSASAASASPAASASASAASSAPAGAASGAPAGEEALSNICDIDPSVCPQIDLDALARRPLQVEIYAVSVGYPLRARRIELESGWSGPFASGPRASHALWAGARYHAHDALSFGLRLAHDRLLGEPREARGPRAFFSSSDRAWEAWAEGSYVWATGKLPFQPGGLSRRWALAVSGGLGLVSLRPHDAPEQAFHPALAALVGLDARWHLTRDVALRAGLRVRAFGERAADADGPSWLGLAGQADLGVSYFVPRWP